MIAFMSKEKQNEKDFKMEEHKGKFEERKSLLADHI